MEFGNSWVRFSALQRIPWQTSYMCYTKLVRTRLNIRNGRTFSIFLVSWQHTEDLLGFVEHIKTSLFPCAFLFYSKGGLGCLNTIVMPAVCWSACSSILSTVLKFKVMAFVSRNAPFTHVLRRTMSRELCQFPMKRCSYISDCSAATKPLK